MGKKAKEVSVEMRDRLVQSWIGDENGKPTIRKLAECTKSRSLQCKILLQDTRNVKRWQSGWERQEVRTNSKR